MVTIKMVLITPEMAKALLATQIRNRCINMKRVALYAKELSEGRWRVSNDAICIGEDGRLSNGQHRLTAIIRSGVPALMAVMYGVPKDAIIDRGQARSVSQSLYMREAVPDDLGTKDAVCMANRFLLAYHQNSGLRFSDDEIAEFIRDNSDEIRTALRICENKRNSNTAITRKAPIRAAVLAALLCDIPESALMNFAEIANTGFQTSPTQSAAIVCRNYVLSTNTGGAAAQEMCQAVAEMAIKDFAKNYPRTRRYAKPGTCLTDIIRKENKIA